MPDPFERHGRAAEREWGGGQPSRSQQRDAAAHDDPSRDRLPSKNKKGACKGPDGWHDGHDLVYVIQPERFSWRRSARLECRWIAAWSIREQKYTAQWGCLHSQVCSRCEHREREFWEMTRVLCPSYTGAEQHPVPQEVLDDVACKQAEYDERAAKFRARFRTAKPYSASRQSYRRKRKGGD